MKKINLQDLVGLINEQLDVQSRKRLKPLKKPRKPVSANHPPIDGAQSTAQPDVGSDDPTRIRQPDEPQQPPGEETKQEKPSGSPGKPSLPPDDGFDEFGTPAELQPLDQDDLKGLEPQQSKSSELDYQKLLRDPVFVSSIADAVIAKLQRTGKI